MTTRRLWLIIVGVVVTAQAAALWLSEAYPLTSWPMYTAPAPTRSVIAVVDARGDIVPIGAHAGLSTARVQKLLRTHLAGAEPERAVSRVLADLHARAATRGAPLPPGTRLAVVNLELRRRGDGLGDDLVAESMLLADGAPGEAP